VLKTDAPARGGALADYFQTGVRLAPREAAWAAADPGRYAAVARAVRGARVLRQDPLECLISFILSSNNNIARIASLVERVAGLYGDPILPADALPALAGLTAPPPPVGALPHASHAWHAFPTLAQLAAADEGALRGAGLGYRARYVVGTAAALASKPGGGEAWLAGLRSEDVPTRDAAAALATLPGVGPKVAACVCLFALDKRDAVPVDTHVWQLAAKHYVPSLRGKTFTPALAERVVDALVGVFGPDAGWAHNALFIAELPSTRAALAAAGAGGGDGSESGESDSDSESEPSSDGGKDGDDDALALGPVTPAERAKRRRRT
jgi:3-methyladenine DNA glycosylase/8-oxoguanine DNA glycosylase